MLVGKSVVPDMVRRGESLAEEMGLGSGPAVSMVAVKLQVVGQPVRREGVFEHVGDFHFVRRGGGRDDLELLSSIDQGLERGVVQKSPEGEAFAQSVQKALDRVERNVGSASRGSDSIGVSRDDYGRSRSGG